VTAFHDPDEALARIQRDIAAAQERAARAQEVKTRIDAVRGVGHSPDRDVEVEVDASGMLRDVTLTSAAMDLHPDDLSRLIVDAAREAQRDAGNRTVALAQDAFGESSPMVAHLRTEVEQRYA
jgi:DNA-binding protein YbaB